MTAPRAPSCPTPSDGARCARRARSCSKSHAFKHLCARCCAVQPDALLHASTSITGRVFDDWTLHPFPQTAVRAAPRGARPRRRSDLASAPAANADDTIGTTPGTYTYYSFPSAADGLSEVTWSTTVEKDPGYNANTFWSHQFGFNVGNGAYIGMQRNGGDKPTFLFSVWDSFERKPGSEGSYCLQFGGEGEGSSCRMNHDWEEGHTYTSTVAYEGDGWFGATIHDKTTGESFKLGSVQTPATAIKPTGLIDWVEYFEWNDPRATCYDQPYSDAHFGLPTGTAVGAARPSAR